MVLFMCTGCEVIHWDGKPTSDHILGEKSLSPPSSHQLSMAPQLGTGPWEPLRLHAGMFN